MVAQEGLILPIVFPTIYIHNGGFFQTTKAMFSKYMSLCCTRKACKVKVNEN